MTEVEPVERTMTDEEEALAAQVWAAIQQASNFSERSQQSADFRIGISDLGFCSEKVRRMVAGVAEPVTDKLPAFIGTALGDHMEQACLAIWPEAIPQTTVSVTLHGDGGDYVLSGHPDLLLPSGLVIDFKTARGLTKTRRTGPSQQQQFQRHCYALGAWEAGYFGDCDLADVQVANVWMDRAGDERSLYVHMEPYSPDVVTQAAMWVDDLVYAYRENIPARKEPPIEMCRKTCGHYEDCRAGEGDLGGLLTDDGVLAMVDVYNDAIRLERQARQMKDEAKAELQGINGSTGKYSVRWIHTAGGHVEFDRRPSERLDIRPLR
jgi:hypothetical protein